MAKGEEKIYLYGRHALKEALLGNPQSIRKIFLDANAEAEQSLTDLLKQKGLSWNRMKEETRGKKVGQDAVHQGVIAELHAEALYTTLEKALEGSVGEKNPSLVLLDELQDPHNVGAIIRSAAAFGAGAVLMPEHNQAPITGAVIKSSGGMALRMPLVRIGNVNQTLRLLKDKGFWVYGLSMEGAVTLKNATFDTPTVFVVGNESMGIREKTLELCDMRLSIPMNPRCESLNAAAAATVVLYEWSRSRGV